MVNSTLRHHVVVVGLDGLRADSFVAAQTPHLDRVIDEGAHTLLAMSSTGQPTNSGPAWSSILTGVWAHKHGVQDNEFGGSRFADFPSFLVRLKRARTDVRTGLFANWAPINEHVPHEAHSERSMISDATVTEEATRAIVEEGLDAIFVQMDEIDGAGHNGGYSRNPGYLQAVARADSFVGEIMDAMTQRKQAYPDERWTVIIVSDHGGTDEGGHGGLTPEEVIVPYFMFGDGVVPGELSGPIYNVDAPVTALAVLGIENDPSWYLDGVSRGLSVE
jgi:predicted AlkP superfamily pyrophosphatase or phosphodiesterase